MAIELKELDFSKKEDFDLFSIQIKRLTKENIEDDEILFVAKTMLDMSGVWISDSNGTSNDLLLKRPTGRLEILVDNHLYCCIIAKHNNVPIGTMQAAYDNILKYVFVNDGFIQLNYRRQKISKLMFDEIIKYSYTCGAKKIRWEAHSKEALQWSESDSMGHGKAIGTVLEIKYPFGQIPAADPPAE